MIKYIFACIISLSILSGCATTYQKTSFWSDEGYSDMQLQKNVFEVVFKSNEWTDQETTRRYALRRCAELTLENNFDYFKIMEGENYLEKSSYTTPQKAQSTTVYMGGVAHTTTSYSGGKTYSSDEPRSRIVIKCFNGATPESDLNAYDARELMAYTEESK